MGDIITEYLRNNFQWQFGGYGVGMLSINADDSRMKRTVIHEYSSDWVEASVVLGNREQYPLGMGGTVCIPKPGSWVKYQATDAFKNVSSFNFVRLFYSNADHSSIIQYSFDENKSVNEHLENGNGIQQLIFKADHKAPKFRIIKLYGTNWLYCS